MTMFGPDGTPAPSKCLTCGSTTFTICGHPDCPLASAWRKQLPSPPPLRLVGEDIDAVYKKTWPPTGDAAQFFGLPPVTRDVEYQGSTLPPPAFASENTVFENDEGWYCQIGFRVYGMWRSKGEAKSGLLTETQRYLARLRTSEAPYSALDREDAARLAGVALAHAITRLDDITTMLLDPAGTRYAPGVTALSLVLAARQDIVKARATYLQPIKDSPDAA